MEKLTQQDMARLEAYWAGADSPSEHEQTAQRLASDEAFRTAAAEMKLLLEQLSEMAAQRDTEDRIARITAKLPPYVPSSKRFDLARKWLPIAAALALLLAAMWWLYRPDALSKEQKLAYGAFQLPTWVGSEMGQSDKWKNEAAKAYNANDYAQAASALERYFKEGGKDPAMRLQLALSYMGDRRPHLALPVLQSLRTQPGMEEKELKWYTALAYLMDQKRDMAEPLLQELSASGMDFAGEAKGLLLQLEADK